MKRAIQYIVVFLLGLLALLFVAANFSATETYYKCTGEIADKNPHTVAVYLKLTSYRWWVGLWNSDSDGNLVLEIPKQWYEYYGRVVDDGDFLRFFKGGNLEGQLSLLSKTLSIETGIGFFDGTCVPE